MSQNRVVPLTIDRRVAVVLIYSDLGRCLAPVDAEDGKNVSTLACSRCRRIGYQTVNPFHDTGSGSSGPWFKNEKTRR